MIKTGNIVPQSKIRDRKTHLKPKKKKRKK